MCIRDSMMGCPAHTANGFNITAQYNHIWNVMQGITSDTGALYLSVGGPDGSGAGNKILNNLVHDITDSSAVDDGVAGYGYGGHGIFLDHHSAGVAVENNVVFRVSDSGFAMSQGPPAGSAGNMFRNNIVAYARKSLFKFPAPWTAAGCADRRQRVSLISNVFQFDGNDASGFRVRQGCSYSCGLDHDKFESFQGNLYWRSGGGFSTDAKAFQVTPQSPANVARCEDSAKVEFLNFARWQALKEDVAGTASVDPGFGKTGQPKDYVLAKSPVAGFDASKTNDTIRQAGRSHPVILPPLVPATFPTFPAKDF